MAVKRSSSASRMLKVFEAVSEHQPVGVSALARLLDADKSAVQRDLMTLADAGWISPAPLTTGSASGQWELTPRIMTFAHPPHSATDLRQRSRAILDQLRGATGETAYLTVPDGDRFVVIEARESPHVLRMAPPVGMVVQLKGTATARAVLPYLPPEAQARWLGTPVSLAHQAEFAATRIRGYAVSDGEIEPSAVALASAILRADGSPAGALVLTGPGERIPPDRRTELGQMLHKAAEQLSDPC